MCSSTLDGVARLSAGVGGGARAAVGGRQPVGVRRAHTRQLRARRARRLRVLRTQIGKYTIQQLL